MRHPLLIVARARMALTADHGERLLVALLALSVFWIQLHSLLEGLHGLVILFVQLVACAFAGPRLHKGGIQFDRLVSVFQGASWLHQLDVGK